MSPRWRTAAAGVTVMTVAGAAILMSAPPRPGEAAVPSAAPAGDVRRGADLYATHCASCHGDAGEGTPDGIPLRRIGTAAVDFVLTTGRMPLANPHQPMERRRSPWTTRDVADLVAFVASLGSGGPAIPAVHPEAGDLVLGGKIFTANCAACHGTAGQGAAVGEGADAPALDEATPEQIAEAVRIGPDPMPRFDAATIDRHSLDSLVRYVTFLRRAPNPGGLSLGHMGPVAEGFVGWAIGLALLVAVIRLIGTTT